MSNDSSSRNDLTTGIIWKKLLIFFFPIAAGTIIQQLYNAVDGLVVGRFVGTVALAAVGGSAAQLVNLLIGFFVAMTTGAAVIIAQFYGAGRKEDIQQASGNAVIICGILGIIVACLGIIFTPEMLALLKTPSDTMSDSITYLRIYFIGVPFILVLNMESNIMRSVGDSVDPFTYMVVGCVTNIILDIIFVIFFKWAVTGVAIATVIAQIINFSLLTRKMLTTEEAYRINLRDLKLNKRYISSMGKLGIPSGLNSSMYSFSNTIIQVAVNSLGTVVVASWAMANKVDAVFWAVSNALGASITSFIGQNFGAGKMDRVKSCVKQGFILSLIITILLSGSLLILRKPIIRLLTTDEEVVEMTAHLLTLFLPFYFTWTIIEVLSSVLKGTGDVTVPVIINCTGICVLRIIWVATVFAHFKTVESLCIVYAISWTVTGIALFIYYKSGKWIKRAQRAIVDN